MDILPSQLYTLVPKEVRCLWYQEFEKAWDSRPNKLPSDWVEGLNLKEQTWEGWRAALTFEFHKGNRINAPSSPSVPDDLRADGWAVAVHNDYRLNGKSYTFWLLTRGDTAVKGEGETDAEALNDIRKALAVTKAEQASRQAGSAYCTCEPTQCQGEGIDRCRWKRMRYTPPPDL